MKDAPGTVELSTDGGQKLVMRDQPAQIKLSTKTGTSITIDDSPSAVRVNTVAGVSVTVTDTGGVTVNAPTGMLTVNSLAVQINATANCMVTAPLVLASGSLVFVDSAMTTFSGVVQCEALITNAVVSSSYTPGAGNIW